MARVFGYFLDDNCMTKRVRTRWNCGRSHLHNPRNYMDLPLLKWVTGGLKKPRELTWVFLSVKICITTVRLTVRILTNNLFIIHWYICIYILFITISQFQLIVCSIVMHALYTLKCTHYFKLKGINSRLYTLCKWNKNNSWVKD
jgi:hypothetical protein